MAMRVWLRINLPEREPELLRREFPGVEFLVGESLAAKDLAEVDAVFLSRMIPEDVLDGMEKVRWIHSTMGGARNLLSPAVMARSIMATSSRGTSARSMSEFAVACMLILMKQILACREMQGDRRKADIGALRPRILEGSQAGVVGLGTIGSAVAQRCSALGMRVIGTRLHVATDPPFVDEVHPPEYFPTLARRADALVLCAPPTPLTEGLVGADLLQSMKPTAVLINVVTRNATVDEVAMVRALKEGRIAGAAFCVFGNAPAPPDESELWDLPNAIVCPGIAAYDPDKWALQRDVFTENLRRFRAGGKLLNLANPAAGY